MARAVSDRSGRRFSDSGSLSPASEGGLYMVLAGLNAGGGFAYPRYAAAMFPNIDATPGGRRLRSQLVQIGPATKNCKSGCSIRCITSQGVCTVQPSRAPVNNEPACCSGQEQRGASPHQQQPLVNLQACAKGTPIGMTQGACLEEAMPQGSDAKGNCNQPKKGPRLQLPCLSGFNPSGSSNRNTTNRVLHAWLSTIKLRHD